MLTSFDCCSQTSFYGAGWCLSFRDSFWTASAAITFSELPESMIRLHTLPLICNENGKDCCIVENPREDVVQGKNVVTSSKRMCPLLILLVIHRIGVWLSSLNSTFTSRPVVSSSSPRRLRVGHADFRWPGSPHEKQRRVPVHKERAWSVGTIAVSGVVLFCVVAVVGVVVVLGASRCWRVEF